jgi:hypothetical protein
LADVGVLTVVVCAITRVSGAEFMVVSSRDPIGRLGSRPETLRDDTCEHGATGGRKPAREAPLINGRSAAGLLTATPRDTQVSTRDRHRAAVARSFGWAEQAAARGDYADALSWVQVVEAIGDPIPTEYQTKRARGSAPWRRAERATSRVRTG